LLRNVIYINILSISLLRINVR